MVGGCTVVLEILAACHLHVWVAPAQGTMQVAHDLEVHSCTHTQSSCHVLTMDDSACIEEADKHQMGDVQVGSWFGRMALVLAEP